jgi:hypothetical protein
MSLRRFSLPVSSGCDDVAALGGVGIHSTSGEDLVAVEDVIEKSLFIVPRPDCDLVLDIVRDS